MVITLEGLDGLNGAQNTKPSISLLYSELEAFIWAIASIRI